MSLGRTDGTGRLPRRAELLNAEHIVVHSAPESEIHLRARYT